jgi:hypothetical protein
VPFLRRVIDRQRLIETARRLESITALLPVRLFVELRRIENAPLKNRARADRREDSGESVLETGRGYVRGSGMARART